MTHIITKKEIDILKVEGSKTFTQQKEEEIKRVKYLFLNKMYNIERDTKMINSSIEYAIQIGRTYTNPVFLSLPYDVVKKEHTLFEQEAVCQIIMDLGYHKFMYIDYSSNGHNKFYFVKTESTPELISTRLTDITFYKEKHHLFFWKTTEVRVYFSIYLD